MTIDFQLYYYNNLENPKVKSELKFFKIYYIYAFLVPKFNGLGLAKRRIID